MTSLLRRRILRGASGVLLTWIAGCENPDSTPLRILTFREMNVEATDGGWIVSLEVVNKNEAAAELATFHDVKVHGYSRDQSEVCSESVGTVPADRHQGNSIPVEMRCSKFPTMLTYSAAESSCDEDVRTVINIAVFDDENGWILERYARECNEGLPPEPRG